MSYIKPTFRHPTSQKNKAGFYKHDYEGKMSSLCAGCGHDSINASIVTACYEMDIEPHRVVKLSGIGCSSKAPAYYLDNSHGFNTVHGRMPSVATGANMANKELVYLGVSGDGDSASIGIGQFVHASRRNINMVYIMMNNGCYGLTKGQDSATADIGSLSKAGSLNQFSPIDMVSLALELGATFVARSFSGDKTQLVPLIKAAMSHPGFAFIDVISPCVTFNNNKGSTKAYDYVRDHIEATSIFDFVPVKEEIAVDYAAGSRKAVTMHDGSLIRLSKLSSGWDPSDKASALNALQQAKARGDILTGLLYIDTESKDLHGMLKTTDVPLNQLSEKDLCPGQAILDEVNKEFR